MHTISNKIKAKDTSRTSLNTASNTVRAEIGKGKVKAFDKTRLDTLLGDFNKVLKERQASEDQYNKQCKRTVEAFFKNDVSTLKAILLEKLNCSDYPLNNESKPHLLNFIDVSFELVKNKENNLSAREAYQFCSAILVAKYSFFHIKGFSDTDKFNFNISRTDGVFSLLKSEELFNEFRNNPLPAVKSTLLRVYAYLKGIDSDLNSDLNKLGLKELSYPGKNGTPELVNLFYKDGNFPILMMIQGLLGLLPESNGESVAFAEISNQIESVYDAVKEYPVGGWIHDLRHFMQAFHRTSKEYKYFMEYYNYLMAIEDYKEFVIAQYALFSLLHELLIGSRKFGKLEDEEQYRNKTIAVSKSFFYGLFYVDFIPQYIAAGVISKEEGDKFLMEWNNEPNTEDKFKWRHMELSMTHGDMISAFSNNYERWKEEQAMMKKGKLPPELEGDDDE